MNRDNLEYRYLKYKYKYHKLRNEMNASHNNVNQSGGSLKGLMVQAPMGSGKSYYLKNRVPEDSLDRILDGDVLLEEKKIKNRNFFWYDSNKVAERKKIIDAFDAELRKGKIILYSGNPALITTDILVLPNSDTRWDRLQSRSDFKPSKEQFDREQKAYEAARDMIPVVFNSDLPDFSVLLALLNQKNK